MTLSARLAVSFALVGALASALVGFFAFRATEVELGDSTDQFLVERADEIARGLRRPPTQRPSPNNGNNAGGDGAVNPVQLPFDADAIAQTLSADGQILDSGERLPVTENTLEMSELRPATLSTDHVRFDDVRIDGEEYRMVSMALPNGGAVQVARATGEADAVVSDLLTRILLISLVVAVFGGALGWLLARRTTRPLRRLAAVAGDVATTRDFDAEVSVTGGDSEVRQLADAFAEMLTALGDSREQQHRLVHDAGHELRTPLTSLRANAALLDRFDRLDDTDRRAVIDAVNEELVELGTLVDELIDLATDQQDQVATLVELDLAELTAGVVERWKRRTDRAIEVDLSPSPVMGDASMLDRAITNLLGNADKFSPPGAPVDVHVAGGRVTVRDRGPGVPAAERMRIFDRFYRSEQTRSMPGSGLGLAIVAQIVARHDGTLVSEAAPDGGAVIGFTLPPAA